MKKVFARVIICFIVIFVMPIKPVEVRAAVSNDTTLSKNLDVNKDLVVDIKDLAILAQYYNVNNKMSNWQDKYDFNGDGTIDIYDLTKMAKYINSSIAISNVTANVEQGKSYNLPQTVSAKIGDNYYVNLLVKWDSATANTSKAGTYSYKGTILDYNKQVTLTLKVEQPNNANINNYGFATFDGTWVYYGNPINGGKLSKAKIDGSSVTKINDDNAVFINVQGNYIYYCNSSDNYSIYKVNIDGTGRTKLTTEPAAYMRVYNNSIYYQKQNENYSLYRMNLDGSNNVKVIEDTPMYINLYEQYMYYSNYSNNAEITRVNLDNSSKINISTTSALNISVQDNYLFYQDYEDEFIYRMNIDGTNVTLVKAVKGIELNAVNGWVYYINESDENTLHRVKYDGSTDEKLSIFSITNFNISGDRIFLYDENGYLYSTNLDGTDLKIFGMCTSVLSIDDQNIQVGQGDNGELPKSVLAEMTDGSKLLLEVVWSSDAVDTRTKGNYRYKGVVQGYSKEINLSVEVVEIGNSNGNLVNDGLIMEKNGWDYYADDTDGKLYKINADGMGKIKLSDDQVKYINVIGDWVYYSNLSDNGKLYKVKTDGSLRTSISSDSMSCLNIVGDWVFYSNATDSNYLYKIKTDGTNRTKLNEEYVSGINVMGNWVYYLNGFVDGSVYRMDKNGYQRNKIGYSTDGGVILSGNNVYAKNGSGILKMNLDGSNPINIEADSYIRDYNVLGNKIYYCDSIDYKLRVMNTDGNERNIVNDYEIEYRQSVYSGITNLQINGDWIYYTYYDDNTLNNSKMYKVKSDGTGRQRVGVDKTIKNIELFSVSLTLGEKFKLPYTVGATNASGEKFDVPVSWSLGNVDTSKLGSTKYEGTVSGYNNKVQLTVIVGNKEVAGNAPNQDFVAQSGDWIIINNFKMKTDGTEKGVYSKEVHEKVSVVGEWVYYSNGGLKKVKIDGTGSTVICEDFAKIIGVLGDWIYYINNSDDRKLYKIRLSGFDKTKVTDDIIGDEFTITSDGWIYYENEIKSTVSIKREFWKMKTDGTGREKLSDDTPSSINVVGDWIYYQSSYTTISKMKTDGSFKTFISDVTQPCNMKVVGDWIYLDNNYRLSKMKTDGSNASQIANMQTTNINVLNNWIYFLGSDGNYYRIRFDGSDKQLLY